MPQLLIVADDLTGAADTAGAFALRGLSVALPISLTNSPNANVISVSTDSREFSPEAAAESVQHVLNHYAGDPAISTETWLFKKVDSALRGQPFAEVLAMFDASSKDRIVVAPAIPNQGRTTVDGRQFADGVPVDQGQFTSAVRTSHLLEGFRDAGARIPVEHISLATVRLGPAHIAAQIRQLPRSLSIVDAETNADLASLAAALVMIGPSTMLAGAAGLGQALATTLPLTPSGERHERTSATGRPVITVAGTRHPVTSAQIAALRDCGVAIFRPAADFASQATGRVDLLAAQIAATIRNGQDVALTTLQVDGLTADAQSIADALGRIAVQICCGNDLSGVVLTGGDIAMAFLHQADATALWLVGELEPAIPVCVVEGGCLKGLSVITKAGSFGNMQTLCHAHDYLRYSTD